jgi:MFS family permease
MRASRQREDGLLLVPALVFICVVVSVVSSLGAPLLPSIAHEDRVSLSEAQWSLTITMLVGATLSPVMGRLGDGPRRRTVIIGALTSVFIGSALAAVGHRNFLVLVLGRGFQGCGLGLMPLTMAVARDHLREERSRRVIALLSIAGAAGVGLGYPITALLAESGGITAAFWFGAAVAAVAIGVSLLILPSPVSAVDRPLDLVGAVLLAAALMGVLLGMTQGRTWGWSSSPTILCLAFGAGAGVIWVGQERRTRHPLVELSLLKLRSVAITNLTALLLAAAIYTFIPVVIDFVQAPRSTGYGLAASVVVAGLMLVPFSLLSTSMSRAAAWIGDRYGDRLVIPLGSLVLAFANLSFAIWAHAIWEGFLAMGLTGIGLGFSFAAMPGLIVRSVPPEETGSALGFYQVVRYVGFSLGSAASATILASYTPLKASFPHRDGFIAALLMAAGFCVFAAVVSLLIRERHPRDRGPVPRARTEELASEIGEVSSVALPFNTEPPTVRILLEDRHRAD